MKYAYNKILPEEETPEYKQNKCNVSIILFGFIVMVILLVCLV